MDDGRLTLRIENRLSEVERATEIVEAYCAEQGIAPAIAYRVQLAIEEILTNAIKYGFDDGKPHAAEFSLRRDGEELVLEISDDGKPFDPTQAPPPKLNAALEERRIGGLGVYLVRTMMDEIAYRRSDGRNHLVMRKRLV